MAYNSTTHVGVTFLFNALSLAEFMVNLTSVYQQIPPHLALTHQLLTQGGENNLFDGKHYSLG